MKFVDLTGRKFGRLTVIERTASTNKNAKWNCVCDCGKSVSVFGTDLKSGKTQSCGCIHSEQLARRNVENATHVSIYGRNAQRSNPQQLPKSPPSWRRIYGIRKQMIDRCYNPNSKPYHNYGGRGITVCKEWIDSELGNSNFYNWAMENGYRDDLTIDRIDNNGNYCPENCRWATRKEQNNNRRNNHLITYNGDTKTATEWEMETGIKSHTILKRLKMGWSEEKALTTKP